jgi:hypothetical protein
MNEKAKIQEAKFFLSQMVTEQENREAFRYLLSAFLSAARSVMQYALEEAKAKRKGRKWHDKKMNKSLMLGYFKDKRNFNIHFAPIEPQKSVWVEITEPVHLSESVHIVLKDKNGKVKETRDIRETQPPLEKVGESSSRSGSTYKFEDWSGGEDVLTLSAMYVKELEKVIEDGVSQGFITG